MQIVITTGLQTEETGIHNREIIRQEIQEEPVRQMVVINLLTVIRLTIALHKETVLQQPLLPIMEAAVITNQADKEVRQVQNQAEEQAARLTIREATADQAACPTEEVLIREDHRKVLRLFVLHQRKEVQDQEKLLQEVSHQDLTIQEEIPVLKEAADLQDNN